MAWSNYEISLWTHRDEFLSVLVQSGQWYSKEAVNPIYKASANGEISVNFSIPIIIYNKENKQWVDNSLWYNKLRNENSLANEKKVKLIFDKFTPSQAIVELVITSLTERREGRQLTCDVACTGYALKWLGKTGYNLTLDSDTVLLEEKEKDITIIPTINYWLDKVFPKTNDGAWATQWSYRIEMDYSDIDPRRDRGKVYENDDVVSWSDSGGTVTPLYNAEPIEKQRFITVSESNRYNITQDIAEIFEVFVRYEFLYEDPRNPFKVTRGVAVFYNKYAEDTEYAITYGDNETGITRTSDSNDIVTKMYVPDIESEFSDNGVISIADAPNNLMKDNFILNFDYYLQSGQLSERQISQITLYQNAIRGLNQSLELTLNARNQKDNEILKYKIDVDTLSDKIIAAQDNVNDYTEKLSAIYNGLGASRLHADKVAYLVSEYGGKKHITFKHAGVIQSTITCSTPNITFKSYELDDYGYVLSAVVDGIDKGHLINVSYDYDLMSYYQNAISTYTALRDSLQVQYAEKAARLGDSITRAPGTLYHELDQLNAQYKQYAEQKEDANLTFENIMGFFLKEGTWQTDDYTAPTESKTKQSCQVFYDTVPQQGEQLSYYLSGVQQRKVYYDYIDIRTLSFANIEQLVIAERWTEGTGASARTMTKQYMYGAQWTPQYMRIGTSNAPVLLFDENSFLQTGRQLYACYNGTEQNITDLYRSGSTNQYNLVYPRYKLTDDSNVITTSIKVLYGDTVLEEFYDYLISFEGITRVITFRVNARIGFNFRQFNLAYECDRTTAQFYYDALDVAKTSAFPNVSYEVQFAYLAHAKNWHQVIDIDPSDISICRKLNDDISLNLGSIVRINDAQLNLRGVKGIVHEITFDLERPQNNSFSIQNYKTRFEDLFGRIVANSEQLSSRGLSYERAATAILPNQQIVGSILQNTINNNNLVFNSGYTSGVTFDDYGITVENNYSYVNGVTGIVVLRGGGIFLSDTVDADGNRIFHTGITPSGINASVLTAGRLDTEKVNIYSGDQVRFAWTGAGLYAYGQDSSGATLYDTYVKFNQDGLAFSKDGFAAVDLGWNGLYLGAQDGSLELTGADGLAMYNGNKDKTDRVALLRLGRFGQNSNYTYGLKLYNDSGAETLVTSNSGELWLKRTLTVGGENSVVGITGEGVATSGSSPIRIWAGSATKSDAPFWVKEDGSIHATKAYIEGEIHATSGEFTGTITASSGTIGGWTINSDSISSGGITLSPQQVNQKGEIVQQATITVGTSDAQKTVISGDGKLTASGVAISGDITATSGSFTGTITATGGKIGNLTIQQVQDMSSDIGALKGDTDVLTVEVRSSNGNITHYNKSFTTELKAYAYIGNIAFSESEYANYNYAWEESDDGSAWSSIAGKIARTWSYSATLTAQKYIRCKMTKKS